MNKKLDKREEHMLQIKEETVNNIMGCIAKAVHPSIEYLVLNNLLSELQQLKPVKEKENEEEESNG